MRFPPLRLRSTGSALALSDACALLAALSLAYCIRIVTDAYLPLIHYLKLVPALLIFLPLYAVLGLYPGILRPPSDELKKLCQASSLGFLFLSFLIFLGQQGILYSRSVILLCWLFTLALVPLFRFWTRTLCARQPWWGYPLVLFAPAKDSQALLTQFRMQREKGLNIAEVVTLETEDAPSPRPPCQGPRLHVGRMQEAGHIMRSLKERHPNALAFIMADGIAEEPREELLQLASSYFRRVVAYVDKTWAKQASLHVAETPFGLALSMRQNLLDPRRLRMKRCLDIFLCFVGGLFFVLLMPLIAFCIRLDSRGPILFTQKRIGQYGKEIRVFKFRTMHSNAQEELEKVLKESPDLREEWERDQKLVRDPRLTRIGAFLRRTSLDELPQLFNVIKGDMSLVGPRPIVEEEVTRYGEAFRLYTRVKPGITGLWQIMGRNDVDYARRVALDQYYVYNWSVWLDIYIIIRTFPALVSGKGAY